MNGDGVADIIAGGFKADPAGKIFAGESHAVFGRNPCPSDLDGGGHVGFEDLLALLFGWGPGGDGPEDLDSEDVVGDTDLMIILESWGPCP